VMMGTYGLLDLVPLGSHEEDADSEMQWVRHHDGSQPAPDATAGVPARSCCAGLGG
jgi:hypothetical protein